MASCTYSCLLNVINLGNSIIGVSILAMPYCFQKCGILLSVVLIFLSGILVRISCYLLLKGAIMARRRNFEFLAFHAFGSTGKLAVEIGVIGFLIGVCIAFFVVIGDLGPPLASQYLMIDNTPHLRAEVLVFLGLFVALPLGLLRKVDSLTSLSALSIAFYGCLVLKIFSEATSNLFLNEWWSKVNWWKPDGLLPCLPIFSMALYCQTQLFEFFDTLVEPSIKRMTSVVSGAVYLCSSVYIAVGVFGYIACYNQTITGNILVNLTPSAMTEFIKLGFIMTVAISFPLCLFPCRTSLHSLLFKPSASHHDPAVNFIPDHRFRLLTFGLVMITIGIAVMIPNIEFVLGIIGSTIGTAICIIFPAVIFIHDTNKNTTEKRLAQVVMFVGFFILVACTYSTLQEKAKAEHKLPKETFILEKPKFDEKIIPAIITAAVSPIPKFIEKVEVNTKPVLNKIVMTDVSTEPTLVIKKGLDEKRHEPPIPREPDIKTSAPKLQNNDIDPQALQNEEKELLKESSKSSPSPPNSVDLSIKEKQEQLLKKLEEQHKEQKKIIEQQRNILEELKQHKEIHNGIVKKEKAAKNIPPLDETVHTETIKENVVNKIVSPEIIASEKDKFAKVPIVQTIGIAKKSIGTNAALNPQNLEQVNPDIRPISPKIVPAVPIISKQSPLAMLNNVNKQARYKNETVNVIEKNLSSPRAKSVNDVAGMKVPKDSQEALGLNLKKPVPHNIQIVPGNDVKVSPKVEALQNEMLKKSEIKVVRPDIVIQSTPSKATAENQSMGVSPVDSEKHEMR